MATKTYSKHVIDQNLLIITVSGDYTVSSKTELIEQYITEMVEKKCTRCMFDFRDADFSVETIPMLKRSELYESLRFPRTVKIAGVFREITRDAHFAETALLNRGWYVKAFTSIDEATNWINT